MLFIKTDANHTNILALKASSLFKKQENILVIVQEIFKSEKNVFNTNFSTIDNLYLTIAFNF